MGGLGRQTEGGGRVGTFWEHFLFIHDIIKTCKSIKIKQIFKSYNKCGSGN